MIENTSDLVWMLPILGISIWLQRAASFLVPVDHLQKGLLQSLNRWAPMAIIAILVLVSLNTGIAPGLLGISIEIALLSGLSILYISTNHVLITVVLAAVLHWIVGCWAVYPALSVSCQILIPVARLLS